MVHTEVIKKIVSLAYIFSAVKEKMNGSRHKMHITVYADMFITQSPEYHLFAKFNCHFMIIAPKRKSWSLFKIQYYYLIITPFACQTNSFCVYISDTNLRYSKLDVADFTTARILTSDRTQRKLRLD